MAHQGIKLLTSWTTAVMELVRSEALKRTAMHQYSAVLSIYSLHYFEWLCWHSPSIVVAFLMLRSCFDRWWT